GGTVVEGGGEALGSGAVQAMRRGVCLSDARRGFENGAGSTGPGSADAGRNTLSGGLPALPPSPDCAQPVGGYRRARNSIKTQRQRRRISRSGLSSFDSDVAALSDLHKDVVAIKQGHPNKRRAVHRKDFYGTLFAIPEQSGKVYIKH